MQLAFSQIELQPGQVLRIHDVNWSCFKEFLNEYIEGRAFRLSYSDEVLQIMSPLAVHEFSKEMIGDLVKILLEELEMEYWPLGSTTFENEKMAKAVEPDECFYIHNEAQVRGKDKLDLTIDPPPDLVIEVDVTHHSQHSLYEQLGVLEFWRYESGRLEIYLLKEDRYVNCQTSYHFPNIPVREVLPHYLKRSKEIGWSAAKREFRAWVCQILK